jgi:predicted nucleic acid-binding protein
LILVDTNVLVDVFSMDPVWQSLSLSALEQAFARDEVAINDIVYAELAPGYDSMADLDDVIARARLSKASMPKAALFLAGKTFERYRRARGTKTNVLPDFFIGAHAAVTDSILLTRDTKRVRTYFPTVRLMSPQDDT